VHLAYLFHVMLLVDELIQVVNLFLLVMAEVLQELLTHLRLLNPLGVAVAECLLCPFNGYRQA